MLHVVVEDHVYIWLHFLEWFIQICSCNVLCLLKGGNVVCREEKCPPVKCSRPVIDPHVCCPICKGKNAFTHAYTHTHGVAPEHFLLGDSTALIVACVLDGVEYDEGSKWHPEGPCSVCTCVNGEALCTHTHCPSNNCLHPTKTPGTTCVCVRLFVCRVCNLFTLLRLLLCIVWKLHL